MSTINSVQPECTIEGEGKGARADCVYDIVHASGSNKICYTKMVNGKSKQACYFNRKVVVSEVGDRLNDKTLNQPNKIGRMKLW